MWRAALLAMVTTACGRGFFNPDLSHDTDASVVGTPPTFVQANVSSSGTTQTQGRVAALTLSQSAGNTIVAVVMWDASSSSIDVLYDDVGNTYVTAVGPTVNTNDWGQAIYVATNIGAAGPGANGVHLGLSALAYVRLAVVEYANVDPAQPLDGTVSAFGGGGTNVSPGGIATTRANDVLVGASSSSATIDGDYPTFTRRTSGPDFVIQDREAELVQSYAPVGSAITNTDWVAQVIALRGR